MFKKMTVLKALKKCWALDFNPSSFLFISFKLESLMPEGMNPGVIIFLIKRGDNVLQISANLQNQGYIGSRIISINSFGIICNNIMNNK